MIICWTQGFFLPLYMITSVEDLDRMLARMIAAKHPERLEELGIDTEYIASLLRPTIELLRRDALVQIEKYHELLRINEERQRQIDTLKAEVFRKTVEMRKLQSRLEELQGNGERPKTVDKPQITSENSSLPPSKDPVGFKRTQSLRQKSDRPTGGQPGHKGYTKEQTALPNRTIECFPDVCPDCGRRIAPSGAHIAERRQIWDLPLPIAPVVTEYHSMECTCQCGCHCRGKLPREATAPVSYGANVHALVGYMSTLQSVPFKRMVDILNNVFGLQMSQGTVSNILQRMRKKAEKEMDAIRTEIERAEVVGADETGVKINSEVSASASALRLERHEYYPDHASAAHSSVRELQSERPHRISRNRLAYLTLTQYFPRSCRPPAGNRGYARQTRTSRSP